MLEVEMWVSKTLPDNPRPYVMLCVCVIVCVFLYQLYYYYRFSPPFFLRRFKKKQRFFEGFFGGIPPVSH